MMLCNVAGSITRNICAAYENVISFFVKIDFPGPEFTNLVIITNITVSIY